MEISTIGVQTPPRNFQKIFWHFLSLYFAFTILSILQLLPSLILHMKLILYFLKNLVIQYFHCACWGHWYLQVSGHLYQSLTWTSPWIWSQRFVGIVNLTKYVVVRFTRSDIRKGFILNFDSLFDIWAYGKLLEFSPITPFLETKRDPTNNQ